MATDLLFEKLDLLKKEGLVDSAYTNARKWLEDKEYSDFYEQVSELIKKGDVSELNDAFYKVIPFGTGGRRGKMGVGTNRINARTIAESAQGFSEYLIEVFGKAEVENRGIVVTYDIRHNSEDFAKIVASVFAGNGIKVYFFDGVRSTPQLSFTIRFKKAIGGAMVSASHNPPSDNGIKVFWETGGQVVPPHDIHIIEKVNSVNKIQQLDFEEARKKGLIVLCDRDVDDSYHGAVADLSLGNYRDVDIVFTPLHGCATTSFLPVLKRVGFDHIFEVKEQMGVDPDFSNVAHHIPNPEVPVSLDLATHYAKEKKADLVLSADPDADRIGVVSREHLDNDTYVFLNGNQIGVLIFDYITKQLKEKKKDLSSYMMIKTVVTTDLLVKIASDNGMHFITDLPVGFKYIADAIENHLEGKEFLFGAEESHGYLYGDYARDKDGAVAALLICEYAALLKQQGKTLFEQLEYIKKEYGYYRELLQAIFFYGMDGMDKMLAIMDALRNNLPKQCCGLHIVSVLDQSVKKNIDPQTGEVVGTYEGFSDNALVFYFNKEKTIRVVVRPSGTEPKIKFYVAVGKEVGLDKSLDEYALIKKEVDGVVSNILEEFVTLAEKISAGGERFEVLG
ncbi:MAG: phospho-sugar mutase [Candidatus Magasanikbacteria bacterium]